MTGRPGNLSYRDIKQIVLDRIQDRTWDRDSLLPSEAELVEEFSSTRTTVNRALRELADEGYLSRKRRAGTRVLSAPKRQAKVAIPLIREEVEDSGATYRYSLVERANRNAPDWLAARLELARDQQVVHVRCMHFANNAPFAYEDRWINPVCVPAVLEEGFETLGPNEWLIQSVPLSNLEISFSASKADDELASFLDASVGDPVFTTERTTWLNGTAVTLAKFCFRPGYRMVTQV